MSAVAAPPPRMTRRSPTRLSALAPALLVYAALALASAAHDDLSAEIRRVDAEIGRTPSAAGLYLRRGELNRLAENWAAAFADYHLAETLDPRLAGVSLARGRAAFETGRFERAEAELDSYLRRQPRDPAGFTVRARVLAARGKVREAARDFSIAVNRSREPDPDDYLAWARLLSASGDAARAVRVLDAGASRLGPLVSLAIPALELEEKLGRVDAALRRVDVLAAGARRPETWLARRAAILERAGRHDEARAACTDALAALAQVPDGRRQTGASQALEAQLKSTAARLGANHREEAKTK